VAALAAGHASNLCPAAQPSTCQLPAASIVLLGLAPATAVSSAAPATEAEVIVSAAATTYLGQQRTTCDKSDNTASTCSSSGVLSSRRSSSSSSSSRRWHSRRCTLAVVCRCAAAVQSHSTRCRQVCTAHSGLQQPCLAQCVDLAGTPV
jgi:hypothetical protein